ncbi:MAG: hypothetical protein J2P17_21245 [Mycobacterium sp.]|nr:hypothetical protein [Mycobacterium sp.]
MTDDDHAPALGWFHQVIGLNNQVALLRCPHGDLPDDLVQHMKTQWTLDTGKTPWIQQSETGWTIQPPQAKVLDDLRKRLDTWWSGEWLTKEKQDYLIKYRHEELSKDYRRVIDAAIDAAKPVIIAVAAKYRTCEFRLPLLLEVSVELKKRERDAENI